MLQDSFTRCFKSNPPEPWNWNIYLFPLWCFGVVVRYCILFPLRFLFIAQKFRFFSVLCCGLSCSLFLNTCRCLTLAFGWFIFLSTFIPVHSLLKGQDKLRKNIEVELDSLFLLCLHCVTIPSTIRENFLCFTHV